MECGILLRVLSASAVNACHLCLCDMLLEKLCFDGLDFLER